MAYAMVGIPLGLVMFQSIGERLNKVASVVIKRAKSYLRCQKTEATEMNLMLATGLLSSIIITTGAAVFSRYEGWSYFDSFYYCFVTLTTIGFGDYVALQVNSYPDKFIISLDLYQSVGTYWSLIRKKLKLVDFQRINVRFMEILFSLSGRSCSFCFFTVVNLR